MLYRDWLIMMGMGGAFILIGIGAIFWGRSEERGYYSSLATRRDMREFLEHTPGRAGFGGLKVGGWLAITLGILMLAAGGTLFLLK